MTDLLISEKGFINLTPQRNRTFHVRSGESLTLQVEMEAYPKPHIFSWSFKDYGLRNTTDHVITTYTHGYRYEQNTEFIIAFKWNVTPWFWVGCWLIAVLLQQLHEKFVWNFKNASGFSLKWKLSELEMTFTNKQLCHSVCYMKYMNNIALFSAHYI